MDDRGMALVRTAVVLAFVLLSSAAAWAQKTDVVTLANGDRNHRRYRRAGARALVTRDQRFRDDLVRVGQGCDGRSDAPVRGGHLGWPPLPGQPRTEQRRVDPDYHVNDTITLPLSEVTRIHPIGASLWARLEGSIDAGFTYTRSSGITQFNLNSDIVYRRPAFLLQLTTSDTLVKQRDEDERDDRGSADLSYVRDIGQKWFWAGVGRFESNESLGLTLRSQSAVGWPGAS